MPLGGRTSFLRQPVLQDNLLPRVWHGSCPIPAAKGWQRPWAPGTPCLGFPCTPYCSSLGPPFLRGALTDHASQKAIHTWRSLVPPCVTTSWEGNFERTSQAASPVSQKRWDRSTDGRLRTSISGSGGMAGPKAILVTVPWQHGQWWLWVQCAPRMCHLILSSMPSPIRDPTGDQHKVQVSSSSPRAHKW